MTLGERLDAAHRRSVSLFLQRQQIEAQRLQLAQQAQQIDLTLLQLDGEITLLTTLIQEVTN